MGGRDCRTGRGARRRLGPNQDETQVLGSRVAPTRTPKGNPVVERRTGGGRTRTHPVGETERKDRDGGLSSSGLDPVSYPCERVHPRLGREGLVGVRPARGRFYLVVVRPRSPLWELQTCRGGRSDVIRRGVEETTPVPRGTWRDSRVREESRKRHPSPPNLSPSAGETLPLKKIRRPDLSSQRPGRSPTCDPRPESWRRLESKGSHCSRVDEELGPETLVVTTPRSVRRSGRVTGDTFPYTES